MLYIDGISLDKIRKELASNLVGKSTNKITQTSSLALTLNFGKQRLIISCFPSLSLCYLSSMKEENLLEETTGFSLNLKKHISGSTLTNIEQVDFDRILIFTFSKINEVGEVKKYKLYFEMMGKHSNLILTSFDNKVIDSIKRFSLEDSSSRVLFPGILYELPNLEKKKNPKVLTNEEFNFEIENKSLLKNVEGLGKSLENNLKSFEDLQKILSDEISPKFFLNEHEEIILATVLNIEPKEFSMIKTFETFEDFINEYLNSTNNSNTFKILKDKLLNTVKKEKKKSEKIIASILKDLEEKKDFDKFRELGDVLAASLYSLKKGMTEVELFNFYTEEMCIIELDKLLTPQQNLEKIYKKYNKMKKGVSFNEKRLVEIQDNLKYFIGLENFIENSDSKDNLKVIEEELTSQNILKVNLKKSSKNKKKQQKISQFSFGETNISGVDIIFGRNNIENDSLVTKIANREDTWFHCKDIPGTHVIVNQSINLTDEQIYDIATFCGSKSKVLKGTKLTIDYTKVKYLNKPKGSRPGFVTYKVFKSIIVTV